MEPIDYKTHILIGQTSTGRMTVIWQWPYVPRQADVQRKIDEADGSHTTYLLCTPTSIMPADQNSGRQPPGFFRVAFADRRHRRSERHP
jgi:hypothetical protein